MRSVLGRGDDGGPRIAGFSTRKSHVESPVQRADLFAGAASDALGGAPALLQLLGDKLLMEMKTPADL